MRAATLAPQMTSAQQHAQDETVRVLAHYVREAERWLAGRKLDAGAPLCPCGIALAQCRCPLCADAQRRRRRAVGMTHPR